MHPPPPPPPPSHLHSGGPAWSSSLSEQTNKVGVHQSNISTQTLEQLHLSSCDSEISCSAVPRNQKPKNCRETLTARQQAKPVCSGAQIKSARSEKPAIVPKPSKRDESPPTNRGWEQVENTRRTELLRRATGLKLPSAHRFPGPRPEDGHQSGPDMKAPCSAAFWRCQPIDCPRRRRSQWSRKELRGNDSGALRGPLILIKQI